jgi:hypothetical protein
MAVATRRADVPTKVAHGVTVSLQLLSLGYALLHGPDPVVRAVFAVGGSGAKTDADFISADAPHLTDKCTLEFLRHMRLLTYQSSGLG